MNGKYWIPTVLALAGIAMIVVGGFMPSGYGWGPVRAGCDMPCDPDEFLETGVTGEVVSPATAKTVPAQPSTSIYETQSAGG